MATGTIQPALTVDDVRRFTTEEFDRMVERGVLTDEERVELLDGILVPMTPIGDSHAACVNRLNHLLNARLSQRVLVSVQNAISIPLSRPYPDVALLRSRADYYRSGRPGPADIYLVIEVADTSLRLDRGVKLPAYGHSGIAETWVVDLSSDTILVGSQPGPDGYETVTARPRGERLPVPGFPDVTLTVDEILGPPENAS